MKEGGERWRGGCSAACPQYRGDVISRNGIIGFFAAKSVSTHFSWSSEKEPVQEHLSEILDPLHACIPHWNE